MGRKTMVELPWEDSLLERKVESDLKDLLKTLVAFANSVQPGHTATILIGEKNDGTVAGVTNPDNIQKRVREDCEKIYPSIAGFWRQIVYEKDGGFCVRVDIEYSGATPHFGEAAWVRRGSESIKASDEVFQRLIEFRLSKVRELAKWVDKVITVEGDASSWDFRDGAVHDHPRWPGQFSARLRFVNSFWATFEAFEGKLPEGPKTLSEPLEKLMLSWDDHAKRLKVLVKL
ncbi:MAG: ATP-binding protein [Acidobacteria bacterium]|nr:ATP-binding protein [Acidobacteriota bacterium]